MSLKELLGEELYQQVTEKAGDQKIAIVSNGEWFPKDKFNQANEDNKDLKQQLKDRDTQLDHLKIKAKGNDDLQQEIDTLKQTNQTTTTEYEDKLKKQAFDFALEKAITGEKARNPKAVKALLDTESIKLDGDKLLGLEDQLKGLKESDAYLFGEPDKLGGRDPHNSDPNNPPPKKNPFSKEHFSLTEQGRIFKEEPEMYKQLKAQAGK